MREYAGIVAGNEIKAADILNALNIVYKAATDVLPPTGIILPYGGAAAPANWAFCDGRAVSRTAYPRTYAAIGTYWNSSSPEAPIPDTHFAIPDLRGASPRGVGTSSGFINTQNNQHDSVTVTLAQRDNDAIRNITGNLRGVDGAYNRAHVWGFAPGQNGTFYVGQELSIYNKYGGEYSAASGSTANFDASRVVPTASENRVKARGVNFIILLW